MCDKKLQFPVSRIGNVDNPKLVILLENSASHPDYLEFSVEHRMKIDGVFKPRPPINTEENMDFPTILKYDIWWYKFWEVCKKAYGDLQKEDILALEFYPYFTRRDEKNNEIYGAKKYQDKWKGYPEESLKKNIEILNQAILEEVPIFVYYKSGWYNDYKHFPYKSNLRKIDKNIGNVKDKYISHYNPKRTFPSQIRERLGKFLSNRDIREKIESLRKKDSFECEQ